MIARDTDLYLHDLVKHTNLQLPYSDYISSDTFPEQITELLNTEITIKYRNLYIPDSKILYTKPEITRNGEKISSRPEDDDQYIEEETPLYDQHDIYTGSFKVYRADKADPYVMILVSKDYSKVIVSTTAKNDDGTYKYLDIVHEYPRQRNLFIGLDLTDHYAGKLDTFSAVTIDIDNTEPGYGVIVETVKDNVIRLLLDTEVMAKVNNYKYIRAVMNDEKVTKYRKTVLGGKTIYGTV